MARFALLVVLLAGCSVGKQAKLHATLLGATHGVIDTAGHGIEEACPLAVERAPTVERAREVAAACRNARDVQHTIVEAWMAWATATLARLERRKADLGLALLAARRLVGFYRELDATLEGFDVLDLPDLPPLLLQLVDGED